MSAYDASPEPDGRDYKPSTAVTAALVGSAALSALGCSFVIFSYCRWRRLRRHPGNLIFWRSVADVLFCVQFVGSHLYHLTQSDTGNGVNNSDCQGFSFVSQFTAMAAELFMGMLSADLLISITNPFTNFKVNNRWYHSIAWGFSILTAALVLTLKQDDKPIYGRDNYLAICWIRRYQDAADTDTDIYFWLLFVLPLCIIYAFAVVALIIASRRLAQGLPETFEARLQIFRSSWRFVMCYLIYWIVAAGCYWMINLLDDAAPPEALSLVLAFALGGRGVVTVLVWILSYGQDIKCTRRGLSMPSKAGADAGYIPARGSFLKGASPGAGGGGSGSGSGKPEGEDAENADLRPHLNNALRKEILYYTTLGIARSVLRAERDVHVDGVRTKGRIAYNKIYLSRRHEERGLFTLEKRKLEARRSSSTGARLPTGTGSGGQAYIGIKLDVSPTHSPAATPRPGDVRGGGGSGLATQDQLQSVVHTLHSVPSMESFPQPSSHGTGLDGMGFGAGGSSALRAALEPGSASPTSAHSRPTASINASRSLSPPSGSGMDSHSGGRGGGGSRGGGSRGGGSKGRDSSNSLTGSGSADTGTPRLAADYDDTGDAGEAEAEADAEATSGGCTRFLRSIGLWPSAGPAKGGGGKSAPLLTPAPRRNPSRRSLSNGATGSGASVSAKKGKQMDFTFVDYEPHLFARMREMNGITNAEYVQALSRTRREKFSEGASGAFLYFSSCERFIVKTLTHSECEVLLRMLHDYLPYMERHPHALITRFYGVHACTMYGRVMYFAVMHNVFVSNGASIHERYDLKGSWVNRSRVALERGMRTECRYCGQKFKVGSRGNQCPARPNHSHEPNQVLRDADWNYKLRLSDDMAQALGDQIVRDTEFLRRHGIMDYSLLLGVHRNKYKLVETSHGGQQQPSPTLGTQPGPGGGGGAGAGAGAGGSSSYGSGSGSGGARASPHLPPLPPPARQVSNASTAPIEVRRVTQSRSSGSGRSEPHAINVNPLGPSNGSSSGGGSGSGGSQTPQSTGTASAAAAAAAAAGGGGGGGGPGGKPLPQTPGWGFMWSPSDISSPHVGKPGGGGGGRRLGQGIGGQEEAPSMDGPDASTSITDTVPEEEDAGGEEQEEQEAQQGEAEGEDGVLDAVEGSYVGSGSLMDGGAPSGRGAAGRAGRIGRSGGGGGGGALPLPARVLTTPDLGPRAAPHLPAMPTLLGSAHGSVSGTGATAMLLPMSPGPESFVGSRAGPRGAPTLQHQHSLLSRQASDDTVFSVSVPSVSATSAIADEEDGGIFQEEEDAKAAAAAAAASASAAAAATSAAAAASAASAGSRGGAGSAGDDGRSPYMYHHHQSTGDGSGSSFQLLVEAPPGGRGPITPFFQTHRGGMRAVIVEGPGIYYAGIIDILQEYTWAKRAEHFIKTRILMQNVHGVSCIPPDEYAERFRTRVIGQLIDGYEANVQLNENDFTYPPEYIA